MVRLLLAFFFVALPLSAQEALPVVHLRGDFSDAYAPGTLQIVTDTATTHYSVKAKWRGSSSKSFDKKNFSIKLLDEAGQKLNAAILGMRSDNHWLLDAMAVDKARMRNRVSFDLWNDFSESSYVQREFQPASCHGTHGFFVELYLNDSYHGIYCLGEPIDRKQLKLKKTAEGFRGLLYKAFGWYGTVFNNYDPLPEDSAPIWMNWEAVYPDPDDGEATTWRPLFDQICFSVDADTEQFVREVEEKMDVPIIRDLEILYQLISAEDNMGKNTFTYFYNLQKSQKMGFAPWDLDATWGRHTDGRETDAADLKPRNILMLRLEEEHPSYLTQMAERYGELRQSVFSLEALQGRFHKYFDLFQQTGAAAREETRWGGANGISLDFAAERRYIDTWIAERLDFLDAYFTPYTAISPTPAAPQPPAACHDLQGRRIFSPPSHTMPGIYLFQGKKYFKK